VDGSPSSAVYVCLVCGCRDVAATRPRVLRAAAHHLDAIHGELAAAAVLRARARHVRYREVSSSGRDTPTDSQKK
jgi:hypothetical protein